MTNQPAVSCPLIPHDGFVDIVCTVVGFDVHDHYSIDRFYEEFANTDAYADMHDGRTTISVTAPATATVRFLETLPQRITSALSGSHVTEVAVHPASA